MSGPIRVFHCDDSSAFRILVREMLLELGGIEMVGDASSLDEALDRLGPANPDVVLVDLLELDHPDQLLPGLRSVVPHAALIIYSGMPRDSIPPGADGHVHKSAPFSDLHRAIVEAVATRS